MADSTSELHKFTLHHRTRFLIGVTTLFAITGVLAFLLSVALQSWAGPGSLLRSAPANLRAEALFFLLLTATIMVIVIYRTPAQLSINANGFTITSIIGVSRTRRWEDIRRIELCIDIEQKLQRIRLQLDGRSNLLIRSKVSPLAAIGDAISEHAPTTCETCFEISLPPEQS